MAGLVPAIHVFAEDRNSASLAPMRAADPEWCDLYEDLNARFARTDVDGRDKPGHDGRGVSVGVRAAQLAALRSHGRVPAGASRWPGAGW